jgi:hypothetical protein
MLPSNNPRDFVQPTPAEREELIEYAKGWLEWASGTKHFIETGELSGSLEVGGGTHGDLRDAASIGFRRKLVGLYRPCEREVETARDWHDYCDEHGYPRIQEPPPGYPPHPEHGGGVWVGLTWAEVRKELRGEGDPQQLDLLAGAVV